MSIEAQNYVRDLKLGNPTRKLILLLLADRADEEFSCFPSVPLLAAEAEISDRAVQKHLAVLREAGLVSDRERRRKDGTQSSNRYYLHGPWDGYGGTGKPFETIIKPHILRQQQWKTESPVDGNFRANTTASKTAGQEQGELQDTLPSPGVFENSAEEDRVNSRTPSPVNSRTPSPVNCGSPLESPGANRQDQAQKHTPASPGAALPGGECVSGQESPEEIGQRVARELAAKMNVPQQRQEEAVALPGGMALVEGKVVGAPTAWEQGWNDRPWSEEE